MDSNPKTMRQRYNDNRNYQADHILLPSSPTKHSSISHPPDLSGDQPKSTIIDTSDQTVRPVYRGTARQPPNIVNEIRSNTSKKLKERPGPIRSPYFDNDGSPRIRANGNVKEMKNAQLFNREHSAGLANKFVAVDGTRRGSDVHASSDADEIQSLPTTVGQNADPGAIFTVKEIRPNSPLRQSFSILTTNTDADEHSRLAPSIIKPSFTSSDAKRSIGRPSRAAQQNKEAKPPWSVSLTAISLPPKLLKDDDLGLVYDQKQNEYYIQLRGSSITSTHGSLRIRPQKLVKVLWEQSGNRLRLESSRSGTEDNILDLEFAHERDITVLLERLGKSGSLMIMGKSRYAFPTFKRGIIYRSSLTGVVNT